MNSGEHKATLMSLLESRFGLKNAEARLLADHMVTVGEDILNGKPAEKIQAEIRLFLDEFRQDISILEHRRMNRMKNDGKKHKKKTQLDIFNTVKASQG